MSVPREWVAQDAAERPTASKRVFNGTRTS
jgi:hypothetical protein